MPIYLDNSFVDQLYRDSFPEEICFAYSKIFEETQNIAITPLIAQNLINKYLLPLVENISLQIIELKKIPTWNDIYFYAQKFSIEGQKHQLILLKEISFIIKVIYEKSAKVSRHFLMPESREVESFLLLCSAEKVEIPSLHINVDKQPIDILKYCPYCWRQPAFRRKFCHHHSPIILNQQISITRKQNPFYQEGRRQKMAFLEALEDSMLTLEWDIGIDKNPSGFFKDMPKRSYLLPDKNKIYWLQQHRPCVFNFLKGKNKRIIEENLIKLLLKYLHSIEYYQVDPSTHQAYKEINRTIVNEPVLIWPMLVRAEAWLMVREKQRQKWGGKRRGSAINFM